MSGGVADVYDEDGTFHQRCNQAMVALDPVLKESEQKAQMDVAVWHRGQSDEAQLKKMISEHLRLTGSKRARDLLDHWEQARAKFVKVFPHEYKRALGEMQAKPTAVAKEKSSAKASA
jgi:glutamate synthase domain-containing protein 3